MWKAILLTSIFLSPVRADLVSEGRASFARLCGPCHNADAAGGERGPSLRSRRIDAAELRRIVRAGVPERGMPAFNLEPARMDELVAFLGSLPVIRPEDREKKSVRLQLKSGQIYTGVLLNESSFDLQLMDSGGMLRSIRREEVASLMPVGPISIQPEAPREPFRRIADPGPGEWPTYNGQLGGNRHSALTQITPANVKQLAPRWLFGIREQQNLEVTPVVMDGIMYVTAANQVFALDAKTGRQIWRYRRDRTKGLAGDAASGINRGVAILGNRLFLVTDHAHLLALDRTDGKLLWDVEMADYRQNYGATGAPLVVNDLVISGVSGGDEGNRGFIAAYRASTGERVWQFWAIPQPGDPAAATWVGKAIEHGCGATWLTGSYDPVAKLLYWTAGNPCPDYNGDERKGDNLYTDSVLALEPDTGKLRWYFQFTPHDLHDWDAVQTVILVDAMWKGAPRKLLAQANRNGFFYVLDRLTGEFLLGKPFAKQTWASGLDAKGRPQVLPGSEPTPQGSVVCPAVEGAANWQSPAYNPATGLFYVMSLDKCTLYTKAEAVWKAGESFYGGNTRRVPGERGQKFLRAISLATGEVVWENAQPGPANSWGGVLSTASNLIFYGDDSGALAAADAKTGRNLWHFHTNQLWKASPMTYAVDGKQYVAVAAGNQVLALALPDSPSTTR